MAITNYLVHFLTEATYNDRKDELRNDAVAFVKDATIIHTHGIDYYCGSGPVALKSDLSGYATTSALNSGLAGKANTSHTHTISQITNLQTTLDGKAASSHTHSISQISGLQTELDSKLESVSLADLGVTATAAELNQLDGIDLDKYALKTEIPTIPSLSGGAATTPGQYVSGVTVTGHTVIVTKANLPSTSLSSLGITATAAEINKLDGLTATTIELNYIDGVTSNIQTQLNGKAASSHTHTSSQVSGLATVATSGSYNDLTNKPSIPAAYTLPTASASTLGGVKIGSGVNISSGVISVTTSSIGAATSSHTHSQYLTNSSLSGYATQSWVEDQGYLTSAPSYSAATSDVLGLVRVGYPESGKNYPVKLNSSNQMYVNVPWTDTNTTYSNATTSNAGLMSAADKEKLDGIQVDADAVSISTNLTSGTQIASITINGTSTALYCSTNVDTKNTTGTSNSTSKLYLAGGTSQSNTGVQTYSNSSVYTQSGQLYATQMNATNGFYETSDARLKNFKDDVKALKVVSEIPTKYFTWKKDEVTENVDPQLHIGTSAQAIQKLYPDLVTANEDGELSVDYARLSIIALAAIKELKAEIDELKVNK